MKNEITENKALSQNSVSGSALSDSEKKQKAIDKIDAEYYDRNSPHYKDNERYSWAVTVINERFK